MAAVNQSVNVSGEKHNVTVVGNDFIMTETYNSVKQKPEFFEPNLEQFKQRKFIRPQITSSLTTTLRQQRLLVLAGTLRVDKSALAGHLAWYLSEALSPRLRHNHGNRIPIREWSGSSTPQGLLAALREEKKKTIFLLPRISPKDVSYDLFSIQNAASSGGHYIVASTDAPLARWKLGQEAKRLFWHELSAQGLYSSTDLANVLVEKLGEAQEYLPTKLLNGAVDPIKPVIGKVDLQTVAEELKTPNNIAIFVQFLCAEKRQLRETVIRQLIKLAQQDDKRVLQQWYHTLLNSREQLLALGMNLFDGLFDDQFFAALEELVKETWQERDPSLRNLDYYDFDNMQHFFSIDHTKNHRAKMESCFSDEQRRLLFEVVWNSHRRQLLMALPTIAQQIRKSAAPNASSNWELYGNKSRRDQFRRVIGETLSDIGLISIRDVERTLLYLIANRNIGVQVVAARSMARWREYEHDDKLFKTLKDWPSNKRILDMIKTILKTKKTQQDKSPRDYIGETVALTISYAAEYDPPNALAQELCDLLKQLSQDQSAPVRARFCSHTLPQVVPLHLVQLRYILRDMTRYIDLDQAIAVSLALAYRGKPTEVLRILDSWHKECIEHPPERINEAKITPRDALLATVALTYGEIQYDEEVGPFTSDEALKQLKKMLAEEKHYLVRKAIILAIGRQARQHFRRIQSELEELVAEVKEEERSKIVEILSEIYLEQRKQLQSGEELFEIKGSNYPIWINSERPLTTIEKVMFDWIKRATNPVAPQIATQACVAFALAIEQKEKQRIEEIREERRHAKQREREQGDRSSAKIKLSVKATGNQQLEQDFLSSQVIPLLATLGTNCDQSVIRYLLPQALALRKSNQSAINFVLAKWNNVPDRDIKIIAECLNRALTLAQNTTRLYIALGGFLVFLVCFLMMMICSS